MSFDFSKLLSDAASEVSRLSKMKANRDVAGLIRVLQEEDSSNRSYAALALGEIGDPRVLEPLIQALKDKDASVRRVAADALGKLHDERALDPLNKALTDPDEDVRRRAAEALGNIKSKER